MDDANSAPVGTDEHLNGPSPHLIYSESRVAETHNSSKPQGVAIGTCVFKWDVHLFSPVKAPLPKRHGRNSSAFFLHDPRGFGSGAGAAAAPSLTPPIDYFPRRAPSITMGVKGRGCFHVCIVARGSFAFTGMNVCRVKTTGKQLVGAIRTFVKQMSAT